MLLICLVGDFAAAADTDQKIEGQWKLVAVERSGRSLPEEIVRQLPGQIVIEGGKIRGMLGDKKIYEATIAVDTTNSPQTYEMTGGVDSKGREVTTRGIYEIDDKGRLRQCFTTGADAKIPKSFNTKETAGSQLVVYERVN